MVGMYSQPSRHGIASRAPASAVTATPNALGQYLTFDLGSDAFAMEILSIKEIIEYQTPSPVPGSPASMRGVINLRGAVVPVLDPRVRFGQSPSPIGKRTCIVIAEIGSGPVVHVVGVLVDAVNEVLQLSAADIEPPPDFSACIHARFVAGIAKLQGRLVVILDMNRTLYADDPLKTDASQFAETTPSEKRHEIFF